MSWLFSRALVEEYSEESCSDGEQCALWNGTPTQQASWLPAKTTEACRLSRSGMTFKPLTDDLGEAVFKSCLAAFPVRTFPPLERERGSTGSEVECGRTWQESSVKFDRDSRSWKTHLCLWEEDLPESSVTLPRWGMMRDGVLWERMPWEPAIIVPASGYVPTPCASDYKGGAVNGRDSEFKHWLKRRHGKNYPHPLRVEEMMGWPVGWTELEPLETDKFRQWLDSHGEF